MRYSLANLARALASLRALCAKATPGPWWSDAIKVEVESCISASRREAGLSPMVEEHQVTVENSHVVVADCSDGLADCPLEEVTANADFIAAARTALPLLLAVAEAAGPAEKDTYGRGFRIMCDDSCGCPQCRLRDAIAALESLNA